MISVEPKRSKSIGPVLLLLPGTRNSGGAMVAATVGPATTTEVAVAIMVVGRAVIVNMNGIFRKRTFGCGRRGHGRERIKKRVGIKNRSF